MNIPETTAHNPDAIRVELGERDRDRVPVAACALATVASASSPICRLSRKLLALGVDPARHLSIWRGRTKCFNDVPIPKRLRSVVPAKVKQLAESMAAIGLQQPITVWSNATDHLELVAGAHRLAAAIKLGWPQIDVILVDDMPEIDRQLWEIDENLMRAELSPTEMAEHLAKREELWVERQSRKVCANESKREDGRGHRPKGFAAETAEKTGVSKRAVQLATSRAKDTQGGASVVHRYRRIAVQGLDLLDDYRGDFPGPAQLDTTVLQHLQGGPGPFRYQRALVAGNGTEHTEEDIGHHTGAGIDPIGDRDQPGTTLLDPFNDGQQVQGAPAKPVDFMRIYHITGLKLIQ